MNILPCDIAFIGGSSTLTVNFSKELKLDYLREIESGLFFETPFGKSPEFKILGLKNEADDEEMIIISCKMHGWRRGVSRAAASQQIFWVFKEAGVKRVFTEGGVGGINHLLDPRNIVIPHDYMDFSLRKDVGLEDRHLLIMRDAICPELRETLFEVAKNRWEYRVFNRGIYVNTDGRHFESPAEISFFKTGGADVVGQSLCPEVYLAREIGACYVGIYLVVNYAEGIVTPWQHEELSEIFYSEGYAFAKIIFEAIRKTSLKKGCQCSELRKETLLKGIY